MVKLCMLPSTYEAFLVPASDAPIASLGVFVLTTDFSMDTEWEDLEFPPFELQQLGALAGVDIVYAYPYPMGILLLSTGNECKPNPRICGLAGVNNRYRSNDPEDNPLPHYYGTGIFLKHKKVIEL